MEHPFESLMKEMREREELVKSLKQLRKELEQRVENDDTVRTMTIRWDNEGVMHVNLKNISNTLEALGALDIAKKDIMSRMVID